MDSIILISGIAGIAFAVVFCVATLIGAIRFVAKDDGSGRLDDNVLIEADAYVAYLMRHTSYDQDRIVEMTATKFDLDRGTVKWMIV